MARKVLLETSYTFTPSTRTISIPKTILRERLLLITNVTTNQVIYNFSDPSLGCTSYNTSTSTAMVENTTLVLEYNTASMSSNDKIQITIDDANETFMPAETLLDTTNKLRVTQPKALIDTDFEYGIQQTKWENLGLYNNKPFAFSRPTPIANISSITYPALSRTVSITLSSGAAPANGTPITVVDTYLTAANGNFVIESGGGTGTFTYAASAINRTGITAIFDPNKTLVTQGDLFTGASIGGLPSSFTYSGRKITVTTQVPHGLALGNEIVVLGSTATTNAPNGNQEVAQITGPSTFHYYVDNAPTGTLGGPMVVYVRPQSTFAHRPNDGGVLFGTNASSNYASCIRQTRRYFRYQSGKGLQVSSGTILKPYAGVESISSVGLVVTVQTKEKHNLQPGTIVKVGGCDQAAYNGSFAIVNVLSDDKFTYEAPAVPSSSLATGAFFVSVESWFGCQNRLGMFDNQNGLYWEYDGTNLSAVKRHSTFQLSGKVTVTQNSATVTQSDAYFPTAFGKQLIPGDYVVIRGQSYKVVGIGTDASMTISPAYRGATTSFAIISKTQETKIKQSEFNMDKLDGTGPSQYNIDLSKMQMFYIDYTWYGAGFVRWGVRGPKGDVIYCHKMPNNNVNTEAYMRSGNLPGRYESSTTPAYTATTQTVLTTDLALNVRSTAGFPGAGTLVIKNESAVEYVNYSAKSDTSFTGLTRGRAGESNLSITQAIGSSEGTVASVANLQPGMRLISTAYPEGTFIHSITGLVIKTSKAALSANPTGVIAAPMGATSAQLFTLDPVSPTMVELAYPSFAASISHWGTSVIMDGGFDDDKSLVFTYGQRTSTSVASGQSRALFAIRVAPSVDNGIAAAFGQRELINRMQLALKALDVTATTATGSANLLVTAILNGVSSSATTWTNAVGNVAGVANSSLSQIADYSGGSTTVTGGEVTAGFFLGSGANSIDLSNVRDLGNSILGGGGTTSNVQIYPDGPDVLTIVVQNIGTSTASVFGRLSWTEAQA
jgi:hypothetical protein